MDGTVVVESSVEVVDSSVSDVVVGAAVTVVDKIGAVPSAAPSSEEQAAATAAHRASTKKIRTRTAVIIPRRYRDRGNEDVARTRYFVLSRQISRLATDC